MKNEEIAVRVAVVHRAWGVAASTSCSPMKETMNLGAAVVAATGILLCINACKIDQLWLSYNELATADGLALPHMPQIIAPDSLRLGAQAR